MDEQEAIKIAIKVLQRWRGTGDFDITDNRLNVAIGLLYEALTEMEES